MLYSRIFLTSFLFILLLNNYSIVLSSSTRELEGTHKTVTVSRVVDGDTIRVYLSNEDRVAGKDEALRILALDTEESSAGGGKPVTPWGKEAKSFALNFFPSGSEVTIEFPGKEPFKECLIRHRGNYGRLLVFVHKGETDYQKIMIEKGYSPYLNKYGNAQFDSLHKLYTQAESKAQSEHIGVWNQEKVNEREMRNYKALSIWWIARASLIDQYRFFKASGADILNTRLDYAELKEKAQNSSPVTIFTELRDLKLIQNDTHAIIRIGSQHQPFSLLIPDINEENGKKILKLLETRYFTSDLSKPGRGYAYVSGGLSLYGEKPQIKVTFLKQINDFPQ